MTNSNPKLEEMLTSGMFSSWRFNPAPAEGSIDRVLDENRKPLPRDYLDFMSLHDGGEGFIGKNYLILWKLGEIDQFNRGYEVQDYAPGILLFGSDGGGDGYGFDMRTESQPVIRVAFVGMNLEDVEVIAPSFSAFLASQAPV